MERNRLAELLAGRDGVFALARAALGSGAALIGGDRPGSAESFRRTFRRRERHTHRTGQASAGFADAVADLEACPERELCLVFVDDRPAGGYWFSVFLTPDLSRVVACFGVGKP
ncbi:hypothetical protein [Amycolatopsis sp. CA-128772]|uniref:hypothetical protein n=1 Tax=Amycolatopsis sp. CA-128772 TaxID=2073159 RepID=UPI000CD0C240|nr:hypothetical protein [Amycolatopsis sp. CA-128772]